MTKKLGTLTVRSEPSDATATVGDMCKITPAIFDLRSKATPYTVIIEKAGYNDYTHKVSIREGDKIEISAQLDEIGK